MANKEMIYLDYMNSWKETPVIVQNCNHNPVVINISNTVVQHECPICGYFYRVDSGD